MEFVDPMKIFNWPPNLVVPAEKRDWRAGTPSKISQGIAVVLFPTLTSFPFYAGFDR
jgi:hypothetical protein